MIDKDIEILEKAIKVLIGNDTGIKLDFEGTAQAIENVLKELETYKKIAEKLAEYIWEYDCCEYEIGKEGKCKGYYIDKDCTEQCIIDWARNEVDSNGKK